MFFQMHILIFEWLLHIFERIICIVCFFLIFQDQLLQSAAAASGGDKGSGSNRELAQQLALQQQYFLQQLQQARYFVPGASQFMFPSGSAAGESWSENEETKYEYSSPISTWKIVSKNQKIYSYAFPEKKLNQI